MALAMADRSPTRVLQCFERASAKLRCLCLTIPADVGITPNNNSYRDYCKCTLKKVWECDEERTD